MTDEDVGAAFRSLDVREAIEHVSAVLDRALREMRAVPVEELEARRHASVVKELRKLDPTLPEDMTFPFERTWDEFGATVHERLDFHNGRLFVERNVTMPAPAHDFKLDLKVD